MYNPTSSHRPLWIAKRLRQQFTIGKDALAIIAHAQAGIQTCIRRFTESPLPGKDAMQQRRVLRKMLKLKRETCCMLYFNHARSFILRAESFLLPSLPHSYCSITLHAEVRCSTSTSSLARCRASLPAPSAVAPDCL